MHAVSNTQYFNASSAEQDVTGVSRARWLTFCEVSVVWHIVAPDRVAGALRGEPA